MLRRLLWTCLAVVAAQPLNSVAGTIGTVIVEREVLLESGVPASPNAIIPTPDGGFVIVGKIAEAEYARRARFRLRQTWSH